MEHQEDIYREKLENIFHFAINNNDEEIMKTLIFPGSPVLSTVVYNYQDTFLHLLCRSKNPSIVIVQLLIDFGINIDKQNIEGNTALHLATQFCEAPGDIIKVLLINGANRDIKNKKELTPIEQSLLLGRLEVAEQFLKEEDKLPNVSEVKRKNRIQHLVKCLLQERNYGNTPSINNFIFLDFLIVESDEETFDYAMNTITFDENGIGFDGGALLLKAALRGTPRMIRALINLGADLDVESKYLGTPLTIAIRNNRKENLFCLLDCGVPVNKVEQSDIETNSPLHYAVCKQNFEIVEKLVEMGADVNALTYHRSPLLLACGSIHSQKWFPHSFSALKSAFYTGNGVNLNNIRDFPLSAKIVEFLLDHGADIEAKNASNRTALDHACRFGKLNIVKLLLSRGAKINQGDVSTLHHAVRGENPAIVKLILKQGANVNYRCAPEKMLWVCPHYESPPPRTPLECALNFIRQDSICKEIIEILIDYGVNVNVVDPIRRQTPLHLACLCNKGTLFIICNSKSRSATIELLLRRSANVNALDNDGLAPLNYALHNIYTLVIERQTSIFLQPDVMTLITFIAIIIEKRECLAKQNLVLLEDEFIRPFYQKCANELSLMKKSICESTNFSFFNILSKDIEYLGGALKNKDILHVLTSGEYEMDFPIYRECLKSRIQDATSRQLLVDLTIVLFHKCVSKNLLVELILYIFKFLNLYDFKIFAKACFVDVE